MCEDALEHCFSEPRSALLIAQPSDIPVHSIDNPSALDRLATEKPTSSNPLLIRPRNFTKRDRISRHNDRARRRWWRERKGPSTSDQLHIQAPSATLHRVDMVIRAASDPDRGKNQGRSI